MIGCIRCHNALDANGDCLFCDAPDKDAAAAIERVFRELAAKQEPLGKEFEDVLYDNLWDLYAS